MSKTMHLDVVTLDRAPEHGTGGELVSVWDADPKGVAAKLLEEAAEAFGAWQLVDMCARMDAPSVCDCARYHDECDVKGNLAHELADVIVLACDIAMLYGIDVQAALDRCEARNRERGRVDA